MAVQDSNDPFPTTATWWQTMTGDGKATWNRSDKSEHVGYVRNYDADYEGDDKFSVFRGIGLRSHCRACGDGHTGHLIRPEDYLGHAASEHEAALMLQDYCEDAADVVKFRGKKPIHRRDAKHPRARKGWF